MKKAHSLEEIEDRLFALGDEDYRTFQLPLIPGIDPERVIGVRMPALRALARELGPEGGAVLFESLPHRYFEETNLHGLILNGIKDFDRCLYEIDRLLPYVDNWATCDLLSPKAFARDPERLLPPIGRWMDSGKTYTVRFAIGRLMAYFLDERFDPKYLDWVSGVRSEEYYVNMMIAWYLATALAKQYEATLPLFQAGGLPIWVHNKAIQKAKESFRVSEAHKGELEALRRRRGGA